MRRLKEEIRYTKDGGSEAARNCTILSKCFLVKGCLVVVYSSTVEVDSKRSTKYLTTYPGKQICIKTLLKGFFSCGCLLIQIRRPTNGLIRTEYLLLLLQLWNM